MFPAPHAKTRIEAPGRLLLVVTLILVGGVGAALSQAPRPSRRVTLHATHPDGVPLHREARSSFHGTRLPDGSEVEVLETRDGGHWLRVRLEETEGWITERYTRTHHASNSSDRRAASEVAIDATSPWASPAACEAALASRAPLPAGRARVGSWNIRWFPNGRAGRPREGGGTDIEWLSCVIAWMGVDALAVQEFVTNPAGRNALEDLIGRLEDRTGAAWGRAFDRCPDSGRQHVGLLWNTARVSVSRTRSLPAINPRGGCGGGLRPGLASHLRFAGGADLDLVVVHLDSGEASRDHDHRRESVRRLAELEPELTPGERDLVVVGDFNTMGCPRCEPATDAEEELLRMEATLLGGRPPLARLIPSVPATMYYRRRGWLLDHIFVRRGMEEMAPGAGVHVGGVCDLLGGSAFSGSAPEALTRLSDHCPLTIEIVDRDRDPR